MTLDEPPAYHLLYAKSPYMGSALKLQCPYYVEDLLNGACGIWQHRNAICLTWFCKHSRGQVGLTFWRALQSFLRQMEDALSVWCLTQLEITDESLTAILPSRRDKTVFTPQELDEVVDEKAHRALWGNWAGREAEFYRECGRRVSALSAERALEIGGAEAALRLRVARRAYRALFLTDLPRAVRPGNFRFQLLLTLLGVILLDPISAPWAMAFTGGFGIVAYFSHIIQREREMRSFTHNGALSRFYLDALLGLIPARMHGAERAMRREHETLLTEWMRSSFDTWRLVVILQGLSVTLYAVFSIRVLFNYIARGGEASNTLLLFYWTLNLPVLAQALFGWLERYPIMRNRAPCACSNRSARRTRLVK